jgi:hypothetical protein
VTQPTEQPSTSDPPRGLEALFAAIVAAVMIAWLAQVSAKVLTPWRLWKMMPDLSALWMVAPDWNRAVDMNLIPWLRTRAARAGWDKFAGQHPDWRVRGYTSTDQYTQAHLQQVRNLLVRFPNEVFNMLRQDLAAAVTRGDSVQEIAEQIEHTLSRTGSENWPNRSKVIAVTEVNGAFNAGWYGAAVQTEADLGRPLDKVWLASHDDHVRESHRQADGQRRPLLQPFLVGGFPLKYPGDKLGPPEEVINCRCTAVTEMR